jgi:drug/metabolite transporter (DMT)-like permease
MRCRTITSSPSPGDSFAPPALLLVFSALLFAAMAVVVKVAARALPGPEVAFVRFCVGLLACGAVATRRKFRAQNRVGLLMRGAYGGAAVLCYFLAIEHLPVGLATLLNYTAPVFTALYAAIFLGEGIRATTLGALGLTSIGVALVIDGQAPAGTLGLGPWELVGIVSAVLSGAAVAMIREVRRTDGSWETFAAFCLGGALISAGPAAARWRPPSGREWVALVAVGLLSVAAQILMTYSLRFVRAAVAGVIAQLTPVATLAAGWLLFHDAIDRIAACGAALTLVGVCWGAYVAGSPEPASLSS